MNKNFDRIFDQEPDTNFFFNKPGYGPVLVDGVVSLKNALARMKKEEFYALVTYQDGETLPAEYSPLATQDDLSIRFATISDKARYYNISIGGGIQRVSQLPGGKLLLGPGPETVSLSDLVGNLYNEYVSNMDLEADHPVMK